MKIWLKHIKCAKETVETIPDVFKIALDIFEEDQEEPRQVKMVNYDQATAEADDDNAFSNARDVKLPFNKEDIKLWIPNHSTNFY